MYLYEVQLEEEDGQLTLKLRTLEVLADEGQLFKFKDEKGRTVRTYRKYFYDTPEAAWDAVKVIIESSTVAAEEDLKEVQGKVTHYKDCIETITKELNEIRNQEHPTRHL